ncbi:MAG TPA: ABC transporter ATP-binding protein [Eubacteriales bacterium]|nr:ABC transporter ATP-binding protein [Clostridia bacterium]HRV72375.1 ABC transporter ATP-binding protein [Eubacteriales bacterium]
MYYIKKLLKFVREYKFVSILAPICIIGEVLLETAIPTMMGNLIDNGIQTGDYNYVYSMGARMIIMAFFALVLGALSAVFAAKGSNGFARNLRRGVFSSLTQFSFKNSDKFTTPSLITRLTQDITFVQQSYMMCLRMMFRSPLMLIMAVIMSVRISGNLSVILVAAIPILAAAVAVISLKTFPRFMEMLKRYDELNASTQENLVAIRVVKAFVRSDYEEKKFNKSADAVRKAQFNAEKLLILTMPIMQFTLYACITAVIWFGGRDIAVGTLESGALISFISYVSNILMSLMMISMFFVNLVLSAASVKRIVEVLDEVPAIADNPDCKLVVSDGSVDFDHVSFSYSDDANNLTLTDIDLHIKSGEVIGVIGGSGSGKTSLVQLIPRLYDVMSGELKVGGHDVKQYSLETLRNSIGMVLQKNVLFSGTIRANLRWGNAEASDAEIASACEIACADEFISKLPEGYDYDLGQGGVNVSGGQKQRLCIARALLVHPKILILDDSTSAVDTATDAKIRNGFREVLPDTTKIIIAQRINSVIDADRIVVLDDGRINAVGTHEELLRNNQIYQEVYYSQQKGVE